MNAIPFITMLAGEIVLVYCIFYCAKTGRNVKSLLKERGASIRVMDAYLGLIIFFAVGYLAMLFIFKNGRLQIGIIVGMLLLFGSVFVLFSLRLLNYLFRLLTTIRLNQTDTATGLLNKTAGMNYIKSKLEQDTGDWGLYVIDLDGFKKINDTCGHMIGDLVIGRVATSLRNGVDAEDMVFRFGGDEFAVFTPIKSREEMKQKGKKIYDSIATAEYVFGEKQLWVTGSIGAVMGHYKDTAEELFEQADQAMYHAKRRMDCNCFFSG